MEATTSLPAAGLSAWAPLAPASMDVLLCTRGMPLLLPGGRARPGKDDCAPLADAMLLHGFLARWVRALPRGAARSAEPTAAAEPKALPIASRARSLASALPRSGWGGVPSAPTGPGGDGGAPASPTLPLAVPRDRERFLRLAAAPSAGDTSLRSSPAASGRLEVVSATARARCRLALA